MKQETLKKASLQYRLSTNNKMGIEQVAFESGAKWQQGQDKNKYSEEEVLGILHNYRNHFELYRNLQVLPNMFFEWFEQFKKK